MSHKVINLSHIKEDGIMRNGNKMISQKTQAVINLIIGIMIALIFIAEVIGRIMNSTVLHNVSSIFFPFAIGITMFVVGVSLERRKQPGDELSKELMLKAGSLALYFEVCAVAALGIAMEIAGSLRGNYKFSIEGKDVLMFATFICGVNLAARSVVFLWLDKTPKDWNEEEE